LNHLTGLVLFRFACCTNLDCGLVLWPRAATVFSVKSLSFLPSLDMIRHLPCSLLINWMVTWPC
jgi:hypothetical protein